MLQFIA